MRNSGFANTVWDPDLIEGEPLVVYPILPNQNINEEIRALFLKTIFMAKVKGTGIKPYSSVIVQFLEGMEYILKMKPIDSSKAEIVATATFITEWEENILEKEDLQKLIYLLHESDPDVFFGLVASRSEINNVFNLTFQTITKFMKSRFEKKPTTK
jgi:hypothetical protein